MPKKCLKKMKVTIYIPTKCTFFFFVFVFGELDLKNFKVKVSFTLSNSMLSDLVEIFLGCN